MPFEQAAPEKVSTTLNVESRDWGQTWTLVFFYEAQLCTVQPFCSNEIESVAFQYLVRLFVKGIEEKPRIACTLRGNFSLTNENDRSSFGNLLLTARWNWSSTHQFPARIIYHAITETRRGSKKRRSQTSPPLPSLFTHSSYPSPPLPSIFHHSVLPPVPIWYHIQTLILFKCSTKLSFRRLIIGETFSLFWVN